VTPIDSSDPNAGTVTIEAKFVETSDDRLDGTSLAALRNADRDSSLQLVLNKPEAANLIRGSKRLTRDSV
jgi:hypothetical protein